MRGSGSNQGAFAFVSVPAPVHRVRPFKTQLLKWIGNKQRFAFEIAGCLPERYDRYIEPFLGSGGVLGTVAPKRGLAGDALKPLAELWRAVAHNPAAVKRWYAARRRLVVKLGKREAYERIKARYNESPNPGDLLFLSRACYGGVVRFRKDGYMSTPCGAHLPISTESFAHRVDIWHARLLGTEIRHADFEEIIDEAQEGDAVYCDPPYRHTQSILYGAQSFSLDRLFGAIARAKKRGAFVALSIDGTKKSGKVTCAVDVPPGLFRRVVLVNCGRSMLRRFQMGGRSLEAEQVADRLLLTW